MDEDDRGRAVSGVDGPSRKLGIALPVGFIRPWLEAHVLDHEIPRSERIARVSRNELIRAGDRRNEPGADEHENERGADAPHRGF
jgi:hypothetical protein